MGSGTACSLVAIEAADDGLPPVASSSGISVDTELQFDKHTVDNAYYYLLLLLMLTEVCRYLHVRLAVCGRECVPTRSSSAPLLADELWPPSLGGGTGDVAAEDVVGIPSDGATAGFDGLSWLVYSRPFL
jgi:hypothetical protein